MKKNILARTLGLAAASLVAGAVPQAACAATIVYNNSATFSSQLGASFLDTYSLAQGYNEGIYSNADMSAIVGQTAYFTTRFSNSNLVGNNPIGETDGAYCGGCNGSFRFSFAETSYTVAGGVYGAGFEVNFNRPPFAQPSDTYAFVTFTNNSTANFFLAPQLTSGPGFLPNFFGLTSDLGIASIHVGGLDGAASSNTVVIDNLRIGSAAVISPVPEPTTWAMLVFGFFAVGSVMSGRSAAARASRIRLTYA